MTEVERIRDTLIVHVRSMDRLWAFEGRLEIPLFHVVCAEADPELAWGVAEGHTGSGHLRAGRLRSTPSRNARRGACSMCPEVGHVVAYE